MIHVTRYALHDQSGFTFLELMITIGISIILLTVGTISLFNFRNQQNLENEARSLVTLLTDARNRATHEESNSRWGVWIANPIGARASYALFQVDETLLASSTYTNVPGTIIDQKVLRSGLLLLTPTSGTIADIIFAKLTGLPIASTSVVLALTANPDQQKTVTIGANGLIDYQ